jgi:hypothetical protein
MRTLEQVKTGIAKAKKTDADASMARLMMKFGRLEPGCREWLAGAYPADAAIVREFYRNAPAGHENTPELLGMREWLETV